MSRFPHYLVSLLFCLPLIVVGCVPSLDDDDSSVSDDDDSTPSDDDDSTPSDDDDSTPSDDDDDVSTDVTIVGSYPEAGATDVFVGTTLFVDFSGPTSATPTLTGPGGSTVSFSTFWPSPTRIVVTPDSPLEFSSTYAASIVWTDGDDSMEFTTSDVGSTPVDMDLTGATYAWNVGSGAIVSPQGGEMLLGAGGDFVLLTGITAQNGSDLDLIGGLANTESTIPSQDMCVPTSELSGGAGAAGDDDDSAGDDDDSAGDDDDSAGDDDDSAGAHGEGNWNDPSFVAGPANLQQRVPNPISGVEMELTLYDATFSGTFVASTDGSLPPAIVGGTFSSHIDMRDIDMGPNVSFTCSELSQFMDGIACTSCPHDPTAEECVLVWVVDVTADLIPGLTMVPRSQEVIDADTVTCPPPPPPS